MLLLLFQYINTTTCCCTIKLDDMDLESCAIACTLVILPKFYLLYHWAIRCSDRYACQYDDDTTESSKFLCAQYDQKHKSLPSCPVDPFEPIVIRGNAFRNRIIKAATYEALCDINGVPVDGMAQFQSKMARGGSAMCIVAYGAVSANARSFNAQLICREESVVAMRGVTSAIHAGGSLACVQITHAGYFSDRDLAKDPSKHEQMSAQSIFNPAKFNFCRQMTADDMAKVADDFSAAARAAVKAGFDCIEIHCGHGYLLSQFLSPKLNPGVSLEDRLCYPCEVVRRVRAAVGDSIVVMVKMNVVDGTDAGLKVEESCRIAQAFAACGVDIIGLSGGLILENGLFMLRGQVPLANMISATTDYVKRIALQIFGPLVIPNMEFRELFFRDPALYISRGLREWNAVEAARKGAEGHRVYVCLMGGVHSYNSLHKATMIDGFDFIQSGRATLHDPSIVWKWKEAHVAATLNGPGEMERVLATAAALTGCTKCNMCIVDATMKQKPISCVEW
jgi:2,4-dienoyl-CoA reductase-like NADH-dependent reductase (Old Yellow Enzyme family)